MLNILVLPANQLHKVQKVLFNYIIEDQKIQRSLRQQWTLLSGINHIVIKNHTYIPISEPNWSINKSIAMLYPFTLSYYIHVIYTDSQVYLYCHRVIGVGFINTFTNCSVGLTYWYICMVFDTYGMWFMPKERVQCGPKTTLCFFSSMILSNKIFWTSWSWCC